MGGQSDARPVQVTREQYESLYELQRFLIRIEEAAGGEPPFGIPQVSEWANTVGYVIAGWQTQDVVEKSVDLFFVKYVVYTNGDRTRMIRAWRGDIADGVATWRLEGADRYHSSGIWGAPFHYGELFGATLGDLRDYVDGRGYDPGTEEMERHRAEDLTKAGGTD